jgi:hypothetical protein
MSFRNTVLVEPLGCNRATECRFNSRTRLIHGIPTHAHDVTAEKLVAGTHSFRLRSTSLIGSAFA